MIPRRERIEAICSEVRSLPGDGDILSRFEQIPNQYSDPGEALIAAACFLKGNVSFLGEQEAVFLEQQYAELGSTPGYATRIALLGGLEYNWPRTMPVLVEAIKSPVSNIFHYLQNIGLFDYSDYEIADFSQSIVSLLWVNGQDCRPVCQTHVMIQADGDSIVVRGLAAEYRVEALQTASLFIAKPDDDRQFARLSTLRRPSIHCGERGAPILLTDLITIGPAEAVVIPACPCTTRNCLDQHVLAQIFKTSAVQENLKHILRRALFGNACKVQQWNDLIYGMAVPCLARERGMILDDAAVHIQQIGCYETRRSMLIDPERFMLTRVWRHACKAVFLAPRQNVVCPKCGEMIKSLRKLELWIAIQAPVNVNSDDGIQLLQNLPAAVMDRAEYEDDADDPECDNSIRQASGPAGGLTEV